MITLAIFKARGIVLKENFVNNSDKVLSVLLKDYGKFNIWAKNSRSLKSKLVSETSLFAYSDFVIFDNGKNLSLNQADLIENFYHITEDLEALAYGTYFLELIDKNIQEATPVNESMLLLLKSLLILAKSKSISPKLACKIFEIKFLQINGYMPNFNNCSYCLKNMEKEEEIYFGIMGIVCNKCKHKEKKLIKANKSAVNVFNYIIYSPINDLYKFNVSNELLLIISNIVELYINEHLYTNLKSKNFLYEIENINKIY